MEPTVDQIKQVPARTASPSPTYADIVSRAGPSARSGALPSSAQRRRTATVPKQTVHKQRKLLADGPLTHRNALAAPEADAPVIYRNSRAPPVGDENGFTLVRARKFGMVRGLHPEVDMPQPELDADREIPRGYKFWGCLRIIKKWFQGCRTGVAVDADGPGTIVSGSYGRDGHEY